MITVQPMLDSTLSWASRRRYPVVAAVLGAFATLLVTRHGMAAHPDSAYYWTGADAVRHLRPGTTDVVPFFTRLDLHDIVRSEGHMPFVDFPLGYPLLWGAVATVTGLAVGGRVVAMFCGAAIAVAALATIKPANATRRTAALALTAAAGMVLLPEMATSLGAYQSEPMLCAVVVATAALGIRRLDDGRSTWPMWLVAASAGLIRFVGGVLVLAPLFVELRRCTPARRWAPRLAVAVAPAAANLLWASSQGGQRLRLHGFASADLFEAKFAILGWWWASGGSAERQFADQPGLLHTAVLAATVVAIGLAMTRAIRRSDAAGILLLGTGLVLLAGLMLGMLLFDDFVSFTPRMLLPTQLCLALWLLRSALATEQTVHGLSVSAVLVVLWLCVICAPWRALVHDRPAASWKVRASTARLIRELAPRVVVSNRAENITISLHTPAAYLPPPSNLVTGAPTDYGAVFDGLSCLLQQHHGIVVVEAANDVFGSIDPKTQSWLDGEVTSGRLRELVDGTSTAFVPEATACNDG